MIVALFPELAAPGGVQRAGRHTADALTSFAARRGEKCVLLSLNDPINASYLKLGLQSVAFTGFGRSKLAFVLHAIRAAIDRPSLMVAFHPNLAPVLAAMKLCAPRSRTVVFAHGIEVWQPLGPVRRCALQRSDVIIAPSADTARQVTKYQGVSADKIQKLPWSLGPEFDSSPAASGSYCLPEGFPRGRIILTVGRWDAREAYKGVDNLIKTLPVLLKDVPDLQLVAVGGGSDVPRLSHLAVQLGVAQRVHFLGPMDPQALNSAYSLCDVFALPSSGEGFGLVFLEAMAHGKPVVGGAHGGTPDIIEEGVTGYLVPHGDVALLTLRLRQLLTDELVRRIMGTRALERVRSDFTFDKFARRLDTLLDSLVVP